MTDRDEMQALRQRVDELEAAVYANGQTLDRIITLLRRRDAEALRREPGPAA